MSKNPENTKEIKAKAKKQIVSRLAKGAGSGSGRTYKPYLTVRDVSSLGRYNRSPSVTVGRVHQLLSDLEYHVLLMLDWDSQVIDIREQFPVPLEESQAIAREMGIAHLSYQGVDQVLTTDFLVDINIQGKLVRRAISAKYAKDLDDPRVLEKLELKRRYWTSKGIPFNLVTELEIPQLLQKNVKWFHPYMNHFDLDTHEQQQEYFRILLAAIDQFSSQKITAITSRLDDDYNVDPGTHLSLLRQFLAQRAFYFDIETLTIKELRAKDLTPSHFWLEEDYEYAVGE
jgi:adenylate kinase family enzyme